MVNFEMKIRIYHFDSTYSLDEIYNAALDKSKDILYRYSTE